MSTEKKPKSGVAAKVRLLAEPLAQELGLHLWDVQYAKEGAEWVLKIIIDKDSGVGIDDCVNMTHAVTPVLDTEDPVPQEYVLEVSSAGADRVLKKPEHLDRFIGEEVEIKFYKARDGRKSCVAILRGYTQDVRLTLEENGAQFTLEKQDVAQVRLYPRFS